MFTSGVGDFSAEEFHARANPEGEVQEGPCPLLQPNSAKGVD